MKKLWLMFLCGVLLVSVTGCGKSNQGSKEKETQQKEETVKFNLNDNYYYALDVELNDASCGGFAFPTNAEEYMREEYVYGANYAGLKALDKLEMGEYSDKITYDSEKEKATRTDWDKLKRPAGTGEYDASYQEHEFNVSYWYVILAKNEAGDEFEKSDPNYELVKSIQDGIKEFKKEYLDIIQGRDGYHLQGTCGGPAYEYLLLDEEACSNYNLNCGRW